MIGLLEFLLYLSLSIINCITKTENLVNEDALSRLSIRDEFYFIFYKMFLIFVSSNQVYILYLLCIIYNSYHSYHLS